MTDLSDFDVLIIGGGLVGCSAALFLSRRGMKVVVVEKGYCGAQASGVNYGGVRCQGRPIEQLPLALRARALWDNLPALIGTDGELIISGHLKLGRREEDLASLEAWGQMASAFGIQTSMIGGTTFRSRYPWLGSRVCGGSLCPTDGHANPRLIAFAFSRAAAAAGATLLEQTHLDTIHFDGTRFIAEAGGRTLRATWCINSAGAWANAVAQNFQESVPLETMYPNMWVTEPMPRFITHNLGVEGGGFYARQVDRGNCIIGGGMAQGDGNFAQPSSEVTNRVMAEARSILPALKGALVIRSWSGVEGKTPDKNPIIGASRTTPQLFHAFGFSGGGFLLAPGVGDLLAEWICTGSTSTPIHAFSISRFDRQQEEEACTQ